MRLDGYVEMTATPDLFRFFYPRIAAVIGASDDPRKPGNQAFRKLREKVEADGGQVVPVNPSLSGLEGRTVFPRVQDIPGPVDVAVIVIRDVEAALRDCAEKGVTFAVIFAAGFAETGAEGRERQARAERIAREGGVTLFGPNTSLNAFEAFRRFDGPQIGLITQSGHQGRPIVGYQELGYAFAHWVPTGNEAHLEATDFMEHFVGRSDIGAIAAYIEGFKNPEKLRRVADAALLARKPIILVKVGRTSEGASYAMTHTAHLAGSDRVFDAFCKQFGVIRVDDLDEVAQTAGLFTLLPPRTGERVVVYAISGGTSAHVADLAAHYGLHLPQLGVETQATLRQWLPAYLRIDNPVDNGGVVVMQGENRKILDALMESDEFDLLICPITGIIPGISETLCRDLIDVRNASGKPIVVIWGSPTTNDGFEALVAARIPVFRSFTRCLEALSRYYSWYRKADSYETAFVAERSTSSPVKELPGVSGSLDEHVAKDILAAYGIRSPVERVCQDAEAALVAAREIGFPVVAKLVSPDIAHKTELGLVKIGIDSEAELRKAVDEMYAQAAAAVPDAQITGVLVAEQVSGGVEMLLGIKRDPQFGPVVVVGAGGVLAEVIDDVQMAVLPLGPSQAESLVHCLRSLPLLSGYRGAPPADVPALVAAIEAVERLASEHGQRIKGLDINPLAVLPAGHGVVALDALLVLDDPVGQAIESGRSRH